MKSKAAILACGLLFIPVAAAANVADVFQTLDDGTDLERELLLANFEGSAAGFGAVNNILKLENKPMLYCVPEKIILTGEQLVDILRRFVEVNRTEWPLLPKKRPADILLISLKDAFPCK